MNKKHNYNTKRQQTNKQNKNILHLNSYILECWQHTVPSCWTHMPCGHSSLDVCYIHGSRMLAAHNLPCYISIVLFFTEELYFST